MEKSIAEEYSRSSSGDGRFRSYLDPSHCELCPLLERTFIADLRERSVVDKHLDVSISPVVLLFLQLKSVSRFSHRTSSMSNNLVLLTRCRRGSRTCLLASNTDLMYTAWPRQI